MFSVNKTIIRQIIYTVNKICYNIHRSTFVFALFTTS
jgi:hypothetical protein